MGIPMSLDWRAGTDRWCKTFPRIEEIGAVLHAARMRWQVSFMMRVTVPLPGKGAVQARNDGFIVPLSNSSRYWREAVVEIFHDREAITGRLVEFIGRMWPELIMDGLAR